MRWGVCDEILIIAKYTYVFTPFTLCFFNVFWAYLSLSEVIFMSLACLKNFVN
jgi:hypothetical protein